MAEEPVYNLFGEKEMPKAFRVGRPKKVWCANTANKIKLLLALGWTNERIANAVGMSQPTMRRLYFSVLKARDSARDVVEARRVELLYMASEGGNVGAIKELGKVLNMADALAALEARVKTAERRSVNPQETKGKKELRQEQAAEIGGRYAAPEGPKLIQ